MAGVNRRWFNPITATSEHPWSCAWTIVIARSLGSGTNVVMNLLEAKAQVEHEGEAVALAGGVERLREIANVTGSYARALPLFFSLKDKPFSLEWSHFMFEPMYKLRDMPRRMLWRTGRQVSKSSNMAASQVLLGTLIPNFNVLTVMPLYEQVRKFSANYVRPFIMGSPIRSIIVQDKLKGPDAVLQRQIGRNSNLFYSYSSGDPSRIRGVSTDAIVIDEVQDADLADLPIIEANMSASKWKLMRLAGTPKTFDNTIQHCWESSSQAHWHIQCHNCPHLNRAAADGDLIKMLGEKTLVCAKCNKPLNSRAGFWVHDMPMMRMDYPGYHVPQPILPMHYEDPQAWQIILDYQREKPTYAFFNEILGEPYDTGSKMITWQEIQDASTVEPCAPEDTPVGQYIWQALGIDWGGRGKEKTSDSEDFISNTTMALAGMHGDGKIDITWLHKVPYEVDMSHEAVMAVNVASQAHATYIGLDYGGQGNVQEQQIRAAGWPLQNIMPFTYAVMAPNRPIVFYQATKKPGVRISYTLDKPRSLLLLCELIKRGWVRLPKSDKYLNDHLRDFMNIYEESMDNPQGSARRLVKRMSRRTDDIVHAINFAVMTIFHLSGNWPQVTGAFIDANWSGEKDPDEDD